MRSQQTLPKGSIVGFGALKREDGEYKYFLKVDFANETVSTNGESCGENVTIPMFVWNAIEDHVLHYLNTRLKESGLPKGKFVVDKKDKCKIAYFDKLLLRELSVLFHAIRIWVDKTKFENKDIPQKVVWERLRTPISNWAAIWPSMKWAISMQISSEPYRQEGWKMAAYDIIFSK